MRWHSFSEFLAMGGYAPYVWGSFGVCLLLMVVEPLLAQLRRSNAITELKREIAARQEHETET